MVGSCQECGAEISDDHPLCEECARTEPMSQSRPLPPLPDGGLADAMPEWLRQETPLAAQASPSPSVRSSPPDFSTILSEDDLPEWLKRVAARESGHQSLAPVAERSDMISDEPRPSLNVADDPATSPPLRRVRIGSTLTPPAATTKPLVPKSDRAVLPAHRGRFAMVVGGLMVAVVIVVLLVVLFG